MKWKMSLLAAVSMLSITSANAAILPGARLFVIDSELPVEAVFRDGAGAGHENIAFLSAPIEIANLFNNHVSTIGSLVTLGTFTANTELIFGIGSDESPGTDGGVVRYFSGPASGNPDNIIHALVDDAFAPNSVLVRFEDLFGGGDLNFGDMGFSLSNVRAEAAVVPVPAPLALLASGLSVLWTRRQRRTSLDA